MANRKIKSVLALGVLTVSLALGASTSTAEEGGSKARSENLRPLITSRIPSDVDPQLSRSLLAEGKLPVAHRLHNLHSWQSLIALTWPMGADGKPLPRLGDKGHSRWASFIETSQIFKPDGSQPDPFSKPRTSLPEVIKTETIADGDLQVPYPDLHEPTHRVLHNLSSTGEVNALDEVNQAFASALWDQSGNPVHYETLLNQTAYDYLVSNQLYNLQGQVAFAKDGAVVDYPVGRHGTDQVGALEVKLAWRIMTEKDILSRYITSESYVLVSDPPSWGKVTVGLVGIHISQKTESAPQRIWSTFEHVDNLRVDDYAAAEDSADFPQRPSFCDPLRPYLPVNIPPEQVDSDGLRRTQVMRVTPIPQAVQDLNQRMQALLAEHHSPLQFYELVDTQWPTDPKSPPAGPDEFPGSVTNNSGGLPTPVYLINTAMETYFQGGINSRDAKGNPLPLEVTIQQLGKPRNAVIPSKSGGNTPAFALPGSLSNSEQIVLSTESCMSCHRPAEIAVSGSGTDPKAYSFVKGNGDFSRILTKARPRL